MSEPILYVDDNFAMGRTRLEAAGYFVRERAPVGRGLFVREKAPGDVADDSISFALQDARIVLMDYELHDVNSASTAPLDGLELLERFRARIRRHHAEGASVPLLTIYSHQIHRLAEQLGECPVVPYMLARRANVDWVFDKGEPPAGSDPLADQIGEMLRAFDINMGGSAAGVERQLATFLALPGESDWRELALEELLDLRPPLQKDLSPPGARVRLMKWLLQDALPFPGCFVDLDTVSLRFRVKPMDLAAAIERNPGSQLARRLDGVRYRGPLASFFLPRYWKAGVDFIVWNMTEGRSPANPVVRTTILDAVGDELPLIDFSDPVLVVSPDSFVLNGEIASMDDSVQIQTDLWPPTLEPPWIRIADISNDRKLRAMVVSKDRDRISEGGA